MIPSVPASRASVEVIVSDALNGQRVDKFISLVLHISRAEASRWIDEGLVVLLNASELLDVGGRLSGAKSAAVKASDKVKPGETYVVTPAAPPATTLVPDPKVEFEVLYMDDDIVVVDKPAGLVVHPAAGNWDGTLVHGLLALGAFRDPALLAGESEEANVRPGIVHRIDKGTSGILVVARNARAREGLKVQFQEHTIGRHYAAIAKGVVEKQVVRSLHGRDPSDRKKFTGKVRSGKLAVTHLEPLESFGTLATLLRCSLETGRTHQIRVHLAEAGHGIVGDPVYGKRATSGPLVKIETTLMRQALHAEYLAFKHPRSGRKVEFKSPLPTDLLVAMESLRAASETVQEGQRRRR